MLERLSGFWNERERLSIALELLAEFSTISMAGPNASYIASCLNSLFLSSKNVFFQLPCRNMKLILRVGYEVQSTFLGDAMEEWLHQNVDAVEEFIAILLSCQFLWSSSSFTNFEARIVCTLAFDSNDLSAKLAMKLSTSDLDLHSIESALLLGSKAKRLPRDAPRTKPIQQALRTYLKRCTPVMERILKGGDLSDHLWEIIPEFVLQSDDVDLEKWLGMICKCDSEALNPKASGAIKSLLDANPQTFHRLLPGWIVRTVSRLTRRFAEDNVLSDCTLRSVEEFSMLLRFNANSQDSLIASVNQNDGIKFMIETKVSYVETMMLAAITHQLDSLEVSDVLVTLLSTLELSPV
jgi:hypothetical protein